MKRPPSSRRRGLWPRVDPLEGRRLPAVVVTSIGQDGVQDLHLRLAGLTGGAIGSIVVRGPSGFEWAYGATPDGAANAEFFASGDGRQGDLYLNPVVRSDLGAGSTGPPVMLPNGSTLGVTVTYASGSPSTDAGSVTVANLASPPAAMTEPAAPSNVVMGDFAVTAIGQDGTFGPGYVHLKVSGLAGRAIASATLNDGAGSSWSQLGASGSKVLDVSEASSLQSADLYFAPTRNETTGGPMTLRLTFRGQGSQHVAQFAGGAWQPGLVATPLDGKSVSGVATQAALAAALNSSGPNEVDTIALAPGASIVVAGPLRVTHSTRIVGNGASLVFTQGAAPWPASASGAIYVANPAVTNIALDLENFTVRFALSGPLRWYAAPGSSALFDPEASPYGARAVIDTSVGNDGRNREVLTLVGMTIDGPPDFDAAPPTRPDASHAYAGEPEIPLVETGDDNGTIVGSTFRGGSVALAGGPWTITGDTHLGAFAGSYTPSAFSFDHPHDVALTSNHVYQSAAGGTTFRLVNFAGSSYGDSVVSNTFIGGQVGNEVTYVKTSAASGFYTGINDSEVILTEAKTFLFEGTPAGVSADGRLLVLPPAAAGVASRTYTDASTGPGLVVSIVDASDPHAGAAYRVAQQVSSSPLTFLMQDPLPSGRYVVSVVAGFVGDTISGNVINLSGKSSTAVVLSGADFGTVVSGNTIEGGSTYSYPYTGGGILVESGVVSNNESAAGAPFPIGYGWSHYPVLGVTVVGNVVFNAIGSMIAEVLHGPGIGADAGRRYLTAAITGNTIAWQAPYLTSWRSAFLAITNGNGNPSNLATDAALPPTVTVGAGFSADGGARMPWTSSDSRGFVDPAELAATVSGNAALLVPTSGASTLLPEPTGQVYAGLVNGAAYASYRFDTAHAAPSGDASPYAPLNAHNLAISQVSVGLSSRFSTIGIGVDAAAGPADLDAHGNSYSASALGPALAWAGATFALGPGDANDVISADGQAIALPSGPFTTIAILGASVFGPQSGTFVVTYTDGTTARVALAFSDWVNGFAGRGTTASGESIAATTSHTDSAGGTFAQPSFVYGRTIPMAQGKTVKSITLPANEKIKVLAIDLV